MTTARRIAALAALSGTVALAGWGAAVVGGLGSPRIENSATPIEEHRATRGVMSLSAAARSVIAPPATAMASVAAVSSHLKLPESAVALAAAFVADVSMADAVKLPDSAAALPATLVTHVPIADPEPPETRVQLASLSPSDPVKENPIPAVRALETPEKCLVLETCIDDYLWSLYERTPKVDTNKVTQRIKTTVKKKGKTRTVTKTITSYVLADFTWKDPKAAERSGMSLRDYVIGGMDRSFRLKLYRALRAMDDAGYMPGITSAFRDDYRQSIASGNKAASDSSYHGGSRRGGYGHGLAADLVSVKGESRLERFGASEELWKWIDAHEKELGVGRPYRDRDPPHVGPLDGKEYADKRGGAKVQTAALQTNNAQKAKLQPRTAQKATLQAKTEPKTALQAKTPAKTTLQTKKPQLAAPKDPGATKRVKPAKSKLSSLQSPASAPR
jgi:hypothetical protein